MTNAASVVTENGMSLLNFYSGGGGGVETFSVVMLMYKLFVGSGFKHY
jgi:hypothetical protein